MKKKILFSKIHYGGLFGMNFKKEIYDDILKVTNNDGFIHSLNYKWYLSDICEKKIEGEEYILGKLNKVIPNEENVSVDKSTKEEKTVINKDIKDNESFFIIYPNKYLIGFESSKTLTNKQFSDAIVSGFRSVNLNVEPEFDLIYDEKFLLEMLDNFKSISYAKFDLKTTNPDSREDFKKIDDLFQATNSNINHLNMRPKRGDSLKFENKESLVRQGLSMSASGYGGGTIDGYDINGNPYTIRTGDNNLKEIVIEDNWTETEIIKKIIFTFNNLDT